jgi:Protein of unknown function DUF45
MRKIKPRGFLKLSKVSEIVPVVLFLLLVWHLLPDMHLVHPTQASQPQAEQSSCSPLYYEEECDDYDEWIGVRRAYAGLFYYNSMMPWFTIVKRRVVRRRKPRVATAKSKAEFKVLSPIARAVVHERLDHFNHYYGYIYGKVFIRNTRTRWGTCSSRGNLGFNYRIAKLPNALQDYIVVHELCHLAQMNHSKDFWELVARTLPDWKARRKALGKYRLD